MQIACCLGFFGALAPLTTGETETLRLGVGQFQRTGDGSCPTRQCYNFQRNLLSATEHMLWADTVDVLSMLMMNVNGHHHSPAVQLKRGSQVCLT